MDADHAGGTHQHKPLVNAQSRARQPRRLQRVFDAPLACAGIGAAAVDHHGLSAAGAGALAVNPHRCRGDLVRSVHGSHRHRLVSDNQSQVLAPLTLDAGLHAARPETLGGRHAAFHKFELLHTGKNGYCEII